jgi:hypothetical protein
MSQHRTAAVVALAGRLERLREGAPVHMLGERQRHVDPRGHARTAPL